MNWLDISIVVVIAWGTRYGWRQGLARELCHTGAALAALVLAWRYASPLAEASARYVALSPAVARFALFCGLLLGVTLLGHCVSSYVERLVVRLHPGLDRWGGGVLGAVKCLLVVTALVVASARLPWAAAQAAVGQSALALHLLSVAPVLYEGIRTILPAAPGAL